MKKQSMCTLLALLIVFLTIQAPAASSAAEAPATTNAPFALIPITPEQIKAASPFFTVDGRDPVILTNPPARLEDLQILRLWQRRRRFSRAIMPSLIYPR